MGESMTSTVFCLFSFLLSSIGSNDINQANWQQQIILQEYNFASILNIRVESLIKCADICSIQGQCQLFTYGHMNCTCFVDHHSGSKAQPISDYDNGMKRYIMVPGGGKHSTGVSDSETTSPVSKVTSTSETAQGLKPENITTCRCNLQGRNMKIKKEPKDLVLVRRNPGKRSFYYMVHHESNLLFRKLKLKVQGGVSALAFDSRCRLYWVAERYQGHVSTLMSACPDGGAKLVIKRWKTTEILHLIWVPRQDNFFLLVEEDGEKILKDMTITGRETMVTKINLDLHSNSFQYDAVERKLYFLTKGTGETKLFSIKYGQKASKFKKVLSIKDSQIGGFIVWPKQKSIFVSRVDKPNNFNIDRIRLKDGKTTKNLCWLMVKKLDEPPRFMALWRGEIFLKFPGSRKVEVCDPKTKYTNNNDNAVPFRKSALIAVG